MNTPERQPPILTSEQVRAARAALQLDQHSLANICGVSVETIKRIERTRGRVRVNQDTLTKLVTGLERNGIVFIDGKKTDFGFGNGIFVKMGMGERSRFETAAAFSDQTYKYFLKLMDDNPKLDDVEYREVFLLTLDLMKKNIDQITEEITNHIISDATSILRKTDVD